MPRSQTGLGMSYEAYKELEYFCLQYKEKKRQIATMYGPKGLRYDSVAHSSGQRGDRTAETALRIGKLKEEVFMIEESARQAGGSLAPYVLKNVTEKMNYEHMAVPCGRRQFYAIRRHFFAILYEKRKNG